jgi:hypothetical protein
MSKLSIMSGRGDNNKKGTSGRGAGNQSNQPFIADGQDQPASSHRKKPTGGKASVNQDKTVDPDADRNQSHDDRPAKKGK